MAAFDRIAWLYHPLMRVSGMPRRAAEKILAAAGPGRERALDVGGGTGLVAERLLASFRNVAVLDPSEGMLAHVPEGISVVKGRSQGIPFKDRSFDLVYAVDALHHFTNGVPVAERPAALEQAVNEMLRVVRDDGVIVVIEFDPTTLRGRLLRFAENALGFGSLFLAPEELAGLFRSRGAEASVEQLDGLSYLCRATRKARVMVFGTFDMLHEGHRFLFREAKKHGTELVVVVARDRTVERVKGRKPDFPEQQRLAAVLAEPGVDSAVLGHEDDQFRVLQEFRPDVVCIGYDQSAFVDELPARLAAIGLLTRIVRLPAYHPERFKSSLLKRRGR